MKYLFLIFLSISVQAQQLTLDSLLIRIKSLPDTSKIKYLNDYAWNNRSKTPHLAMESAKEALRIGEETGNHKLQAASLNYIGVLYRNLGNYDLSLKTYNRALNLSDEIRDSVQIAYALNNIGGIHRLQGNNKSALEYILRALGIFEKLGNKQGMSYCTLNIGIIYRRQQDYIKSLEYLNYTLRIREEINDKPGKALALNQIAEVYDDMGSIDTALKYYFEVEKQYKEIDDRKGLAATWGGIGGIYMKKNNLPEALKYRTKALELSIEIDYLEGLVTNYNNLAKIYYLSGQSAKAEENFSRAFKVAAKMKEVYAILECYRFSAEYREYKKDWKEAARLYKQYYTLRDSITRKENIAMIYQFEANNREMKNAAEKSLLEKENELQKRQALYLVIIVIVAAAFSVVLYKKQRTTRKLNEKLEELNSIKDRFFHIIAHDLKNPFASLLGFSEILEEDFETLSGDEKLQLIKEMRISIKSNYHLLENLLYWAVSQRERTIISKEKICLKTVAEEIKTQFQVSVRNKKLEVECSIDPAIIVYADLDMTRAVMRNIISNAIKFSPAGEKLFISARIREKEVEVLVEDRGAGIPPDRIKDIFKFEKIQTSRGTEGEKGTGLGLILCKEFVESNSGRIWIESELGRGTKIFFTLPSAE